MHDDATKDAFIGRLAEALGDETGPAPGPVGPMPTEPGKSNQQFAVVVEDSTVVVALASDAGQAVEKVRSYVRDTEGDDAARTYDFVAYPLVMTLSGS